MSDAPARLVVRMPNWLGDAVMALPAVRAVRRHFPEAALTVAAQPSVAPLFEEDAGLGGSARLVLRGGRRAQAQVLGGGRFDAILLLTNSFGSAWVARRSGIPARWGYRADGRGLLLTRGVRRPKGHVHQVDYYRALAEGLGIARDEAPPAIAPGEETRQRAARVLERHGWTPDRLLVGFAPGAAYGHAKRWPPARVAEVIARLADARGATAVLVGAAGDRDAGRAVESSLAGPARGSLVNLIGQTDLRDAMGVVSWCRAFVTNDSGAMHLAAALGLPVTAVFGPTDERETSPAGAGHAVLAAGVFCRPCMLRDCPIDHRCMKRITPDQVLDAVVRQIDRAGTGALQ